MNYFSEQPLSFYQFDNLRKHTAIRHMVTTRDGGHSSGTFASLNLSCQSGDDIDRVKMNRELVRCAFNPAAKLVLPQQQHTNQVKVISCQNASTEMVSTDALITSEPNIIIGVLAADCVPLLFYDAQKQVIGVAHAGWRGTVLKISVSVIDCFINEFNSDPTHIQVAIGPSISAKNYEVGGDVIDAVANAFPVYGVNFISNQSNRQAHIDLPGLNKAMLIERGIVPGHIETARICTFDCKQQFFSARRQGFHSGRFGVFIMLKDESL